MSKKMTDIEKIDYIVDYFDWERVRVAMVALDWKWCGSDTEDGIPTIGMLVNKGRKLLLECYSKERQNYTISTGGFKATKVYFADKDITDYSLEFVLEGQDTYDVD